MDDVEAALQTLHKYKDRVVPDGSALSALLFLREVSLREERGAISRLQQPSVSALFLSLLAHSEDDQIIDLVSNVMANLCGPSARAGCIRTWNLPLPHQSYVSSTSERSLQHLSSERSLHTEQHLSFPSFLSLRLHELAYTEGDLGWKTWTSARILARLIAQDIIYVRDLSVLEIGCGTGMCGITANKRGARDTLLTDYHERVIQNAERNVTLSHKYRYHILTGEAPASVFLVYIDLFSVSRLLSLLNVKGSPFDLILGSDIVYDTYHAEVLPSLIHKYLKTGGKFYCVLPVSSVRLGVREFETNMQSYGYTCIKTTVDVADTYTNQTQAADIRSQRGENATSQMYGAEREDECDGLPTQHTLYTFSKQ